MAYRYPLVANPDTKRLEEIKETDLLTLYNTGIVSATSIQSVNFYGNLVGIASTSLSLYDASKITLGIINPDRLSGEYDIEVTTSNSLSAAENILSGTISPDRLSGDYDINISGNSGSSDNLNDAANITSGVISRERLTGSYDINITGSAFTSTYSQFSEQADYANFSVGTALEIIEIDVDEVYYPVIASGIGFTFAHINLNNFSFNPYSGNLGVGVSIPKTSFQVNIHGTETGIGTFLAQSSIYSEIDSFDITEFDFKTAEYTIYFEYENQIQSQKILIMQNGVNAYSEEYAIMSHPSSIVSLGSTISGDQCILRALPELGVSGIVSYRFSRNTLL
jgi:hypothetical protein